MGVAKRVAYPNFKFEEWRPLTLLFLTLYCIFIPPGFINTAALGRLRDATGCR